MKIKRLTAISLFIVALFSIIDWIVFTTKNDSLKFNEVKTKYIERLPSFLQNFYANNLGLVTLFFMVCFLVSGYILIKETNKILKAICFLAFLLAFWELFSLM